MKPKVISLYLQNKALLYPTETGQQLTHHSTAIRIQKVPFSP